MSAEAWPRLVLISGSGLTLGGTNRWLLDLAAGWRARGGDAVLIAHEPPPGSPPRMDPSMTGCPVLQAPSGEAIRSSRAAWREALGIYAALAPGLFMPNDAEAAFALCAALMRQRSTDLRVVAVGHGDSDPYMRWMTYYASMMSRRIAVNTTMAERLRKANPCLAQTVEVRACPVDVPDRLARAWSGPNEPLRLVYAGRLAHGDKGVGHLVPLAERLAAQGFAFTLDVYGEGPHRACMEGRLLEASGAVRSNVRLHGMVSRDAMSDAYTRADVVLLPSRYESGGLAMLEGMAHGCVPVATACNGPRDIVEDGVNGFLVALDDVEAMSRRVAELMADRMRLVVMGKAAYETARGRYAFESYIDWFEALVKSCAQGQPARWRRFRGAWATPRFSSRRVRGVMRGMLRKTARQLIGRGKT